MKRQFDEVYNKKHYYWTSDNMRKRTLMFFTELSSYEIPLDFYLKNEEVFFKLIHNTYDESKRTDIHDGMDHMPITELFKDTFGQHPNKKNLMQFFSNEVVRCLWKGAFQQSREFKAWNASFQHYSLADRNKMFKYLSKIDQSAGYKILNE
jgi:hypothetical protein